MDLFSYMCKDIIYLILSFVEDKDLFQFCQVDGRIYNLCDEEFWKKRGLLRMEDFQKKKDAYWNKYSYRNTYKYNAIHSYLKVHQKPIRKYYSKLEDEKVEIYSYGSNDGIFIAWYKESNSLLFRKGRKCEMNECWYMNGQLAQRNTYDDKRNIYIKSWHKNGQLESIINGKIKNEKEYIKHGLQQYWYETDIFPLPHNGPLQLRISFKNGKRDGFCECWYEHPDPKNVGENQIEERSNWKDGDRHGLYETWYAKGGRKERSRWKDGKRDGLYETWYANGKRKEKSNWKRKSI